MQMRTGFGVHRDQVRARPREIPKIGGSGRDHQVHVHERLHMGPDRGDHIGANGQVRHEVSVHRIHVDPVGALGLYGADLGAQFREIRRKDRWRDAQVSVERCGHGSAPRSWPALAIGPS